MMVSCSEFACLYFTQKPGNDNCHSPAFDIVTVPVYFRTAIVLEYFHPKALVLFNRTHLCRHWDYENILPREFFLDNSQSNRRNSSIGKMRTKEIAHHPIDIQGSLKGILIFCIGVGLPAKSGVTTAKRAIECFAVIGMDVSLMNSLLNQCPWGSASADL